MTQVYITIGIIAVIGMLICYVFIRQTMTDKQHERDRLTRALTKRANDLLQILSIFPDNFLPKDIRVFAYRSVIDAYQQLTKLEPDAKQHVEHLQLQSAQLEAAIRQPESTKSTPLESATQINELRQYLSLLNKFLQKSLERQQITQKHYTHYKQQLKGLMAKLSVDSYVIAAKQALQIDKAKLAIHYYDLAKKLLTKETPSNYKDQLHRINTALEPLLEEERAAEQTASTAKAENQGDDQEEASEDDEWDQFKGDDDGWKKKNVYD